MPILYHSPHSRSSRVITQLLLMGKLEEVEVICVGVVKNDGSGRKDPRNAHPEGKVPYLVTDDGQHVRESAAIMMYLEEQFGQPLSPKPGDAQRGPYLSWMSYYGSVLEPVLVAGFAGLYHPALTGTFRTMAEVSAQLERGLAGKPFLLGETFSVADLLMASPFQWAPDFLPDSPEIKAWVGRVAAKLEGLGLEQFDAKAQASLAAAEPA